MSDKPTLTKIMCDLDAIKEDSLQDIAKIEELTCLLIRCVQPLSSFKQVLVRFRSFELAAEIRDIEKGIYDATGVKAGDQDAPEPPQAERSPSTPSEDTND